MEVFIFFIFWALICEYVCKFFSSNVYKPSGLKKGYLIATGIALALIIGLRDQSIGTDTFSYVQDFYFHETNTFHFFEYREPLYGGLVSFLSIFSDNYTILLFTVAVVCVGSVCILFYRYSEWPFLSYVILLSLGFVYFFMAGLRQSIAMSILMFSYKYLRERKLLPFLLLVAFAYGFHNTAVIFLLAYPMAKLKISWIHYALVAGAALISFLVPNLIKIFLFDILQWERLSNYAKGVATGVNSSINLSGFIIQFCIMVFCVFFYKKRMTQEPKDLSLYNIMFLGLAFQVFSPLIGEFFRISMYFSIFNTVLIPNALEAESNKMSNFLMSGSLLTVLMIYYLFFSGTDLTIVPYKIAFDF